MNKITKGAVVGGIGVALLLGGGSTLAYWNDSVAVSGTTITAGDLKITPVGTGAWTVSNGSVTDKPVTINTFRAVPGDVLTYKASFDVVASGDNIRATLTGALGAGAIKPATVGKAEDVALAGRLADNATSTLTVGATTAATHTITTAGTTTVNVTVTIPWAFGAAGSPAQDNPAKTGAVTLDGFNVTVTQTQP